MPETAGLVGDIAPRPYQSWRAAALGDGAPGAESRDGVLRAVRHG